MTYTIPIFTFVETRLFARIVSDYLSDDEYAELHRRSDEGVIWMLTIYAKNEAKDIPAHVVRRIKEEIDG